MTSRILTELRPDEPLRMSATYVFDAEDRRKIDDQILALQTVLDTSLLHGWVAGYFRVEPSLGAALQVRDVVCFSGSSSFVTLATPDALAAVSDRVLGVVVRVGAPGGVACVAMAGVLPPEITRLETAGTVGPDANGRLAVGGSPSLGSADAQGNVFFAQAGGGGSGLPAGGSVGQVVTNTAPGLGEWADTFPPGVEGDYLQVAGDGSIVFAPVTSAGLPEAPDGALIKVDDTGTPDIVPFGTPGTLLVTGGGGVPQFGAAPGADGEVLTVVGGVWESAAAPSGALPAWTAYALPSVLVAWSSPVDGSLQSGWPVNGVATPTSRGIVTLSYNDGTEDEVHEVSNLTEWPENTVLRVTAGGGDTSAISVDRAAGGDVVYRAGVPYETLVIERITGDDNYDVVVQNATYNRELVGRCGGQFTLTLADSADTNVTLPWPDGMRGIIDVRVYATDATDHERRSSSWEVERDTNVTVTAIDSDDAVMDWTVNVVADADELQVFLANETGGTLNLSVSWDGDRQVVP